MTVGLSMSKVRAVLGSADRVFFRFSNGLILYAIAVVTTTQHLGRIALLLTLLAAAIGVLRGALGTPLLLTAGRSQADIRREGSFAVTSALLASPIAGGVMWAVGGPEIRLPAMLIIAATPVVLVEDVLRYVAIAQGRRHVAALWDGLWFAGSAALLVATWLQLPMASTATDLIGGWTALASVALIGMLASVRVAPALKHYRAWISERWQRRARYGADSGLQQTTVFAVLLLAAVVVSPEVAAALVGAAALLAPVAFAASALSSVVMPDRKRQTLPLPQLWGALTRIALVTSCASLLVGVMLYFTPLSVGKLFLGRTFEATHPIILVTAFGYAMAAWITAATVILRTSNRSADALMLEVSYALVTLGTALGGAVLFGTAAGIAVGIATATTFIVALALLRFKPWAAPVSPSTSESPHPVQRDSSPPSVVTTAGDAGAACSVVAGDFLNAGMPKPMPLVTRLRLHEKTTVNEALITLWIFAALAVFLPAAVISSTGIPNNLSWLWSLPATAICAARFAWLIGAGERRLFEVMFWQYAYCFLCLAPLTQLRENVWPETVPRVDGTYVGAAALIVIVGCLAFLAGTGLDNVTSRRRSGRTAKRTRDVVKQVFTINYSRTVLLCAFAILFNIYYLSHVGWIQFLKSRTEANDAYDAIWKPGSLGMMTRACSYMALLVAFIALMRFRGEAKRARTLGQNISSTVMRSNMTLIVIIGILLANSMNPISNARYLAGTAMLAAGTAFGLFATSQRFRLTSCGFLAGLLLIFPLADAFRYTQQGELKANNPIQSLLSPDYDSFAQLMNGYMVGAREGIIPGKQFSGVLAFWLPRAVWTNKPVDTGIYIANQRGYSFTNLSAPLWIEFYLNGGWLPLVIGMFALGFGLHRWDTRLNAQFQIYRMPGLLACILPFYMMILLRGSLLQAASYLFFILMFSVAVLQRRNAETRSRAPTVSPEPHPAVYVEQLRTNHVRA